MVEKRQKLVRTDPHPIILGISRTRNDARRVRNVMEPLQTPKTAIKKIKIKDFGVSDLGPQGAPLFSYDRESPIGPRWAAVWGHPLWSFLILSVWVQPLRSLGSLGFK